MVPSLPSAGEILPWLHQIDENRRYTNFGPLCQAFERRARPTCRCTYAVVYRAALWVWSLPSTPWKSRRGARVLLPALTFPATASAVIRSGLTPLFSDIDERTLSLTPEIARRAACDTQN